jgi:hypothetical protein
MKEHDKDQQQESWIVYSKDQLYSEDERVYLEYLKFKDLTELILELGVLKYELKCFEREIASLPRDKSDKALRRKERTFRNICAVEKEISKRMNAKKH